MIRVAIIGTGAIARTHIEAYRQFPDRCRIVALCDIYPEKAEAYRTRYALDARVTANYREVMDAADVDLVSVCTPPYVHAEITVAALQAGKHVLVEKPMAAALDECDAMVAAAERTGRVLSVVAQNRFRTEVQRFKAAVDSGLLGRVLHVQVDSLWWRGHSYYDLWWRGTWEKEGGGPTLNHAVHHIDQLQWLMGLPSEVVAVMGNVAHNNAEVEDLSMAILTYPGPAFAQVTSSVVHHGQEQQIVVQGERARVSWPWKVHASRSLENGFPERDPDREAALESVYRQVPPLLHEHHVGQIDDVLTAIETGRPVLVDGYAGRRTLELITAIYKAASTKSSVALPLPPDDLFYRRATFLRAVPHFYEKTGAVENFRQNDITTEGRY